MQAMRLVETKGLVGWLAATDAMAKAATVQIVKNLSLQGFVIAAVLGWLGRIASYLSPNLPSSKPGGRD